jgi:hypothetical protein
MEDLFEFLENHAHTFKFASHSGRISVRFNESDVSFDDWALVLDPVAGSVLVSIQGSCSERLDVLVQHQTFRFVGNESFSLLKFFDHQFEQWGVVTTSNTEATAFKVFSIPSQSFKRTFFNGSQTDLPEDKFNFLIAQCSFT